MTKKVNQNMIYVLLKITFFILIAQYAAFNIRTAPTQCFVPELDYNKTCFCFIDYNVRTNMITLMVCPHYLPANASKLPDLPYGSVSIHKAYVKWPSVPESLQNTTSLDLSENQISEFNNLTYLYNLVYFNLSRNTINKINPDICRVNNLTTFDLSYNALTYIEFQSFFCDPYSFSSLKYLNLKGNKLKEVNGFDLVFTGMPLLNYLDMTQNRFPNLTVRELSDESIRIINTVKDYAASLPSYVLPYIKDNTNITINLSNNVIMYLKLNFEGVYSKISELKKYGNIENNLFLKFLSVNLYADMIRCDCNIYKDFNFLINGPFTQNFYFSYLANASISNTMCVDKNINYNIVEEIQSKLIKVVFYLFYFIF